MICEVREAQRRERKLRLRAHILQAAILVESCYARASTAPILGAQYDISVCYKILVKSGEECLK